MARRPRVLPPLAEPDELDRLVEAEARLERRLVAARAEAARRIAAAEAATRAAEQALEAELAPALSRCRESAARRLADRQSELRAAAVEQAAALDCLVGPRFDALVDRVLTRIAESPA